MNSSAKFVILAHKLSGHQIAILSSQITIVSQGDDGLTYICEVNDNEPLIVQEKWEEIMLQWTGDSSYKDTNIIPKFVKNSEKEEEAE